MNIYVHSHGGEGIVVTMPVDTITITALLAFLQNKQIHDVDLVGNTETWRLTKH